MIITCLVVFLIAMLSIIVPVDLDRRPNDLIRKLHLLITHKNANQLHFVIAHNHRGSWFDDQLVKILSCIKNVVLVSKPFYKGPINNSLLRNKAVLHADSFCLLLLDADLVPDQELFFKCAEQIKSGQREMIVLPCLYLSKYGSHLLTKKNETPAALFKRFLKFDRTPFLHIASPSSITFLTRENYWLIGGFDEAFTGHGYEDFDFMLRLGIKLGLIKHEIDMLEDVVCRSPLLASGFRKYLGRLSLPHFLSQEVIFHLHHGKNQRERYYKSRTINRELFISKNKHLSISTDVKSEMILIQDFFSLCSKKNLNPQDYSILFDNRPGHVDRPKSFYRTVKLFFTS